MTDGYKVVYVTIKRIPNQRNGILANHNDKCLKSSTLQNVFQITSKEFRYCGL